MEMVQFLIGGGEEALVRATEASEDFAEQGRRDMGKGPGKKDVVVGIAASGCTPYTIAPKYARTRGTATVAITGNPGSELGRTAQLRIEINVGPEVLTGSSRPKVGTAQKLICNMLTTGTMTKLGYVYSNLMVNLQLKNKKLLERGVVILQTLACVDRNTAIQTLEQAEMNLPLALVMLKSNTAQD